jgi:hypothetical protein
MEKMVEHQSSLMTAFGQQTLRLKGTKSGLLAGLGKKSRQLPDYGITLTMLTRNFRL